MPGANLSLSVHSGAFQSLLRPRSSKVLPPTTPVTQRQIGRDDFCLKGAMGHAGLPTRGHVWSALV
eukprot:9488286-Pyramimonas_sp.AAC.1